MRHSLLVFLLLLLATACSQPAARPLKPQRVLPQVVDGVANVVLDEPSDVPFAQLASTPDAFTDRLIRATGTYVLLEPPLRCPTNSSIKGPVPLWGMVADELQMNAVGFEQIVTLVSEGEQFVVDGVWKKYVGPVGCGKEPQSQVVYYLDVLRILQPNPITRNGGGSPIGQAPASTLDESGVDSEDTLAPPLDDSAEPPEEPLPDQEEDVAPESIAPPQSGYPSVQSQTPTNDNPPPPTATRDLTPPTPTPSRTPTPRSSGNTETNVPAPTRTPLPTSVPRATATPEPTATRTPLPTSEPRVTATPEPAGTPDEADATATPASDEDATSTPVPDETPTPDPDEDIPPEDDEDAATPDPDVTPDATPTETPIAVATDEGEESEGTPVPTETPNPYPVNTPDPNVTPVPTEAYPES